MSEEHGVCLRLRCFLQMQMRLSAPTLSQPASQPAFLLPSISQSVNTSMRINKSALRPVPFAPITNSQFHNSFLPPIPSRPQPQLLISNSQSQHQFQFHPTPFHSAPSHAATPNATQKKKKKRHSAVQPAIACVVQLWLQFGGARTVSRAGPRLARGVSRSVEGRLRACLLCE
ncbi:uncharacterized protein K452DRAFT_117485 [Aplosporella prunicola CBS 121167]|uniref:Uncharacterized protein n=1 Tax=Aplosporella prunicola CBS 121167 TaxID=1176127 RepID=A0A6A6AZZ4_9PEZI|nr:uncharacterized protein K452DRAFT_117485 [Aplosporella prunicola CBS 121167]KAF2136848.1 hypothetical protein K452DRAFT_117485 [Aplosporella prunicola CBS 121167]